MKYLFLTLIALFSYRALSAQGTFTEVIPLDCGDSTRTRTLGYPTWNPPQIVKKARFGRAFTDASNRLVYLSTPFYKGRDTVVVLCARATQITCDTGIFVFENRCANAAATVHVAYTPCRDTLCDYSMSSWGGPQWIQKPRHGAATISLSPVDGPAKLWYLPDPAFEGTDYGLVNYYSKLHLVVLHVVCGLTGTAEMPSLPLQPMPNPTADFVRIALDKAPLSVLCVHSAGRLTSAPFTWAHDQLVLDLREVPSGLYYLCVQVRGGQRYAKVVKR